MSDEQLEESKGKENDKNAEENKGNKNCQEPLINPEVLNKGKVIINTSSSKAMYSFGKAERFNYKQKGNQNFCYNLPSVMDKRAASIGYGNKVDFTKVNRSGKSENIYNIPREFELDKKNNGSPKYTMGYGRDVCRMPQTKKESQSPSPFSYNPYKKFGEGSTKFSMSFRYGADKRPNGFPGPGQYKYDQINTQGKYGSSILRNSQLSKFGAAERFSYNYNKFPGVGTYNPESMIKGNGIIYNSCLKSSGAISMGKENRFATVGRSMVTPGPGSYDFFSDFEGFSKGKTLKFSSQKNKEAEKN